MSIYPFSLYLSLYIYIYSQEIKFTSSGLISPPSVSPPVAAAAAAAFKWPLVAVLVVDGSSSPLSSSCDASQSIAGLKMKVDCF